MHQINCDVGQGKGIPEMQTAVEMEREKCSAFGWREHPWVRGTREGRERKRDERSKGEGQREREARGKVGRIDAEIVKPTK